MICNVFSHTSPWSPWCTQALPGHRSRSEGSLQCSEQLPSGVMWLTTIECSWWIQNHKPHPKERKTEFILEPNVSDQGLGIESFRFPIFHVLPWEVANEISLATGQRSLKLFTGLISGAQVGGHSKVGETLLQVSSDGILSFQTHGANGWLRKLFKVSRVMRTLSPTWGWRWATFKGTEETIWLWSATFQLFMFLTFSL